MRTAITTLALAGLTTAASAQFTQGTGTVTITTSASTVNVGDVFTIGVLLSDDIPGNSVFAFDLQVTGTGAAFSSVPDSLLADPSGSGHVFVFEGQLTADGASGAGLPADILSPDLSTPFDDLTVFTFQVQATQAGVTSFAPTAGPAEGFLDVFGGIAPVHQTEIVLTPGEYEEVNFVGTAITVIPAPSSVTPLALAIPLAARRRR